MDVPGNVYESIESIGSVVLLKSHIVVTGNLNVSTHVTNWNDRFFRGKLTAFGTGLAVQENSLEIWEFPVVTNEHFISLSKVLHARNDFSPTEAVLFIDDMNPRLVTNSWLEKSFNLIFIHTCCPILPGEQNLDDGLSNVSLEFTRLFGMDWMVELRSQRNLVFDTSFDLIHVTCVREDVFAEL